MAHCASAVLAREVLVKLWCWWLRSQIMAWTAGRCSWLSLFEALRGTGKTELCCHAMRQRTRLG